MWRGQALQSSKRNRITAIIEFYGSSSQKLLLPGHNDSFHCIAKRFNPQLPLMVWGLTSVSSNKSWTGFWRATTLSNTTPPYQHTSSTLKIYKVNKSLLCVLPSSFFFLSPICFSSSLRNNNFLKLPRRYGKIQLLNTGKLDSIWKFPLLDSHELPGRRGRKKDQG